MGHLVSNVDISIHILQEQDCFVYCCIIFNSPNFPRRTFSDIYYKMKNSI
uniref:Uncharacterized protein n=1 Tax=Anguilla anguilla TaxID=7936 RepID=A0A0E9QYL5_ANGAN